MKTISSRSLVRLLTLSALALIGQVASAQFVEHFDYADGAAYQSVWMFGNTDQFNPIGMQDPNLINESGGSVSFTNDRIKRSLGATYGNGDQTVFLSFLFQTPGTSATTGGLFRSLELYNEPGTIGDNTTNRVYSIGLLRNDGNTASAQFEHRAYGTGFTSTTTPDLGAANTNVNLFVVKFTFTNGGANFSIDAWLNPTSATDFDQASNTISGTAGLAFNTVGLASFAELGGAGSFNADEIVLSSSSPIAIPEPSTHAALVGLGALGLTLLCRRSRA